MFDVARTGDHERDDRASSMPAGVGARPRAVVAGAGDTVRCGPSPTKIYRHVLFTRVRAARDGSRGWECLVVLPRVRYPQPNKRQDHGETGMEIQRPRAVLAILAEGHNRHETLEHIAGCQCCCHAGW